MTITLRSTKGSALTYTEMDDNFSEVQTLVDKAYVSVTDFGAVGDGVTDDTAAIQAAIDSGYSLYFPAGTYLACGLTQTTDSQRMFALGAVFIKKNANGVILTASGQWFECNGIEFRGDASTPTFTGDNLVFTGNNQRLINCGSRWAYGRALLATGSHMQITGTCDIYQTTDTAADAYDIEIGVSGTATLYHNIDGIVTTRATGGIKLIDTGSHTISNSQFGKLYIAAGTGPSGVNGGSTANNRIIGSTTVEVSDACFVGNTHGDDVTFSATTSNCRFDGSNVLAGGKVVVNNGTQNLIVNGSNDGLQEETGRIKVFPNNSAVRFRKADGTAAAGATAQFLMSTGDNFSVTNNVSGKTTLIEQVGAGQVRLAANSLGGLEVSGANAKIAYGTSTPAGGTAGVGLTFGTATNLGIFFGSGVPTLAAAKGSMYLRTDGTGTTDRAYINTDGSTTWTALTTAG